MLLRCGLELNSSIPKVTVRKAKANLDRLIQKVWSGEEVVIVKGKKPLVRFVAALEDAKPKKRRIGGAKGVIGFIPDDFNALLDDFKDYM